MSALTNIKHETAAQALASGKTQRDAYEAGGFKYQPANASKFFNRRDVRARVQEIVAERIERERKSTEAAVRKVGLTKEWVIERLMWNAERCLRGTPVRDENGKHTGQFTGKVDAAGANRALELLGKHLGMFIDRHEIGEPGQFARMTDEELNAALAAQAQAFGFSQEQIDLLLSNRIDATKH